MDERLCYNPGSEDKGYSLGSHGFYDDLGILELILLSLPGAMVFICGRMFHRPGQRSMGSTYIVF